MRTLVLSNMAPSADAPGRGAFVRTQVAALRRVGDVEVELEEFAPGLGSLARAARAARGRRGFDVVHAHFGLTAYAALAVPGAKRALTVHGTDVHHPRTGRLTRLVA